MTAAVDVRTSLVAAAAVEAEWEALADRLDASPFLRPGWVLRWHAAYGRGRLLVATAHRGDQLVAVLPVRRRAGLIFSPTNWHTPEFGVLAADERAAAGVVGEVLGRRALQVQLAFLDESSTRLVREVATQRGWSGLEQVVGESPHVPLVGGFDAYRSGLSRNTRRQLSRRRRDLEARGVVGLDVHDAWDEELFEAFLRVEGSGWKEARGSAIRNRPADLAFYRGVAQWASGRGWLRLAFLRLDGEVVAGDLALECAGVHHVLKTGYSAEHESCSPGRVLREEMLRRAFEEGLRDYALLGQDARWKRSFRPSYRRQLRVVAFAPGAGVLLRPLQTRARPAASAVRRRVRARRGEA